MGGPLAYGGASVSLLRGLGYFSGPTFGAQNSNGNILKTTSQLGTANRFTQAPFWERTSSRPESTVLGGTCVEKCVFEANAPPRTRNSILYQIVLAFSTSPDFGGMENAFFEANAPPLRKAHFFDDEGARLILAHFLQKTQKLKWERLTRARRDLRP